MTYPEALRAYADWMEKNSDLSIGKGSITLYNNDNDALELVKRGEAEIEIVTSNDICYVNVSQFAPLEVKFVVKKSLLMEPSIKDGEVFWVMKNEFTALGAF